MGMYFCDGCDMYHDSKDGKSIALVKGRMLCEDAVEELKEQKQAADAEKAEACHE